MRSYFKGIPSWFECVGSNLYDEHPELVRPLFIEEHPLTANQFKSFIDCEQPSDPLQGRAYVMFMYFVAHIEGNIHSKVYCIQVN